MERLLASSFTPRQLEIAQLLANGLNSKSIADKLKIARGTVETHLYNIKNVAQAKNAPHLVAKLLRENLID